MARPDYYVCDGEKCEDCSKGKFATVGECYYCIHKLMPKLAYPFEDSELIDEEAVHQIPRDDFPNPPPTA